MKSLNLFTNGTKKTLKIGLIMLLAAGLAPIANAEAREASGTKPTKVKLETAAKAKAQSAKVEKLSDYIQDEYQVSEQKAEKIVAEAMNTAAKHDNVDPELILAIIAVESTFKEKAVSRAGARGLMQVMPRYHHQHIQAIGGTHALFDPAKNIHVGSQILMSYLDQNRGNLRRALLRYNGSLGNPKSRYADKVLRVYNNLRNV